MKQTPDLNGRIRARLGQSRAELRLPEAAEPAPAPRPWTGRRLSKQCGRPTGRAGHWAFGSRPRRCDGREGARCPSRTPTVIASQRCRAPARRPSLRTRWWSAHWRGRRGAPSAGTGVGPQSRRQVRATQRAGPGSGHHLKSMPWRDSSSWALAGPRGAAAGGGLPPSQGRARRRAGHRDGPRASATAACARLLGLGGTGPLSVPARAPRCSRCGADRPLLTPPHCSLCWNAPERCPSPAAGRSGGFWGNQLPCRFRNGRIGLCEVALG